MDLVFRKPSFIKTINDSTLHGSPLSVHILFYTQKIKIPTPKISKLLSKIVYVDLSSKILKHSLSGPTSDLEDNIQLHSAVEANCDIFLTSDKKLLKMGYFGKTRISSEIEQMSI